MFKHLIVSLAVVATPCAVRAQSAPPTDPGSATAADHSTMDHAAHRKMMEEQARQRQSEVAARGQDVMPFSLAQTTHVFTKTAQGGDQEVLAKKPADKVQVDAVRGHLRRIREQFSNGDYAAPAHIHGSDMPGLAELSAARPGQLAIVYKDVPGGGRLTYRTEDAGLVSALHRWFDAQLADHGQDAVDGHAHHHGTQAP